jgi:hypothetical protein
MLDTTRRGINRQIYIIGKEGGRRRQDKEEESKRYLGVSRQWLLNQECFSW